MRNVDKWHETKYSIKNGRMYASDDSAELGSGSYLMASLIAEEYSDLIAKYANGSLLDIGCGKVPMYGLYKNHIDNCTCVDWGNSLHGNEYIDIETDISQELPLEDNSFDTIICSDVLEHIWNPEFTLSELKRVCRKGGHIIINTPFSYWMHEVPYDYHRYTPFFYEKYAEQNSDIELIESKCVGGWREVLVDIIGKVIQGRFPLLSKRMQQKCLRRYIRHKMDKTDADPNWTMFVTAVFEKN